MGIYENHFKIKYINSITFECFYCVHLEKDVLGQSQVGDGTLKIFMKDNFGGLGGGGLVREKEQPNAQYNPLTIEIAQA